MDAITTIEAKKIINENKNNKKFEIIDVRTKFEYEQGHIKNSINIDLQTLNHKINFFSKDKKYLLYCRTDARSKYAHQILKNMGFKTQYLIDGYLGWESQNN